MSEYNDWPPTQNHRPPLCVTHWQNELNKIAGFSPNGLPLLRLEWGSTCTWTRDNRDLKYFYSNRESQIGWNVDVRDSSGKVVDILRLPLNAKNIPQPDVTYGLPYPRMLKEQLGIPRLYIAEYIPPSLVGPWDEVRHRLMSRLDREIDIGSYPREGFYYLGFHMMAYHTTTCCERAKNLRQKCFGYYRDPSDLDILYVSSLVQLKNHTYDGHDWTEPADDRTMYKILKNMVDMKEDQSKKEREAMKLRIRDAFKSHQGRFRARKGVSQFIIHKPEGFF